MKNETTNQEELKNEALAYFKKVGIDPYTEVSQKPIEVPPPSPVEISQLKSSKSNTTHKCSISLWAGAVVTYYSVKYKSGAGNHWKFSGHAWGLGVGAATGDGLIVYNDASELHDTKDCYVQFIAEDGGALQISWGKYGVATAGGIGEGLGAFGGSGTWSH